MKDSGRGTLHNQHMKSKQSHNLRWVGILALILLQISAADAVGMERRADLLCVRLEDEATIHVGQSYASFTEVIVVGTIILDHNKEPGIKNFARFTFAPLLAKEGKANRLVFPVLEPHLSVSQGKIWRWRFNNGDLKDATSVETMKSDGRYVVDIEFDDKPPGKFVLTLQMTSPCGIKAGTEIVYWPSADGFPGNLAYPEPSHFLLRVCPEAALGSWHVEQQEGMIVPSKDGSWVEVQKGKKYMIQIDEKKPGMVSQPATEAGPARPTPPK
jgi:hypothetical protein